MGDYTQRAADSKIKHNAITQKNWTTQLKFSFRKKPPIKYYKQEYPEDRQYDFLYNKPKPKKLTEVQKKMKRLNGYIKDINNYTAKIKYLESLPKLSALGKQQLADYKSMLYQTKVYKKFLEKELPPLNSVGATEKKREEQNPVQFNQKINRY